MAMLGNSNATNPPATATGSCSYCGSAIGSSSGSGSGSGGSGGYGMGAGTANDPIKLPQGITDFRIKGSSFDNTAELHENDFKTANWVKLPAVFLTNPLRFRIQYTDGIPVGLRAYKIIQNGLESNHLYIQVNEDSVNAAPTINAVGANDNVFEVSM